MKKRIALVTLLLAGCASGLGGSPWEATHTTDPITGESRCVVARYDRSGSMLFTRPTYLYPMVETHSEHGLLVGVSSGGKVRLPVGDILWRVDDNPYREIRAAETPVTEEHQLPAEGEQAAAGYAAVMQAVTAATATATLASGETAEAMLDEMVNGTGLLFRAEAAASNIGLPDSRAQGVGEMTGEGELRPVPLDASFRESLEECGISG